VAREAGEGRVRRFPIADLRLMIEGLFVCITGRNAGATVRCLSIDNRKSTIGNRK
jgi:hypothetical protein